MTITKMMDILAGIVSNQDYKPQGETTFCNLFTDAAVSRLTGFTGFHGKIANDIVGLMRYDPENWAEVNNAEAITWGAAGSLVVAGWHNLLGHGHVCIVWPSDQPAPGSAKWGLASVPFVCSVGAIVAAKIGANWVFSEQPTYFKWKGALVI